jgi:hypothetical protein
MRIRRKRRRRFNLIGSKMTLKEFELNEFNHFIAMEYYLLILNRTYLILLTEGSLIGIKANGLVSVEGGKHIVSKNVSDSLAIKGNLQNPYSYIKEKYIREAENDNLFDGSILRKNKSNFIIKRAHIKNVSYDQRKKWGMGYYPHDGKVYIETDNSKRREFIILGNQSGQKIANLIATK